MPLDGTSHTPTELSFQGFNAAEANGVINLSGSKFTYLTGTNIHISGSNEISCTLQPLEVLLDGTAHTPSSLSFTGFTATESGGQIVRQAPTGGGSRVDLSPSYGINITGSRGTFSIANSKAAPAYQCIGSDGSQATNQPDTVTNLVFQNFTNILLSNTLTLTPEPRGPIRRRRWDADLRADDQQH